MKMDMDELLTHALAPDEEAGREINGQLLRTCRKADTMKQNLTTHKLSRLAAAICAALLLCSATAFAAIHFLTPAEIADTLSDEALAKAFSGQDAVLVNEAQIFEDYKVTFLGTVSGKSISDFIAENDSAEKELAEESTYAVTAIEKTDGTPMPELTEAEPFLVSPYIKGEDPSRINAFTMNGGYREIVKDGVSYRITDCDSLEMFADRETYLGVTSSSFYDRDAYNWDAKTGVLTPNPDYDGVNALFTLPLNKEKADPEAAKRYLEALTEEDSQEENEPPKDTADEEETPLSWEYLKENCTLLEDSVKTTKPDKDNMICYSYDAGNSSIDGETLFDELFPDKKPGLSVCCMGWGDDLLTTYELMEDGTVTVRTYQKK